MEFIFQWIVQYGYIALFASMMLGIIGLPIPDETLLTFSGYLVSTNVLLLHFTLLAAYLGSFSGITVSYEAGKRLGLPFLKRYGSKFSMMEEKLQKAQRWYNKFDRWILVVGYFIPGVRHLSAFLAGVSGLPYRTFALFAYSGAVLWSTTFVLIGKFVGANWQIVADDLRGHAITATVIIIGAVIVVLVARRFLVGRKK